MYPSGQKAKLKYMRYQQPSKEFLSTSKKIDRGLATHLPLLAVPLPLVDQHLVADVLPHSTVTTLQARAIVL